MSYAGSANAGLDGLIALAGAPPPVEVAEAEAAARSLYGLEATAEPLAGERDRNFHLLTADGPRVLKFIDPAADDRVVDGQSAVLTHLAARSPQLPVPRLCRTLDGRDLGHAQTVTGHWRVRLVTYLSGELLADIQPDGRLLLATGRQIAALDRALRDFDHPALGQRIAWDIRQAPVLARILPRIAPLCAQELIARALEPVPALIRALGTLHSQAIHGDCHARNLLVNAQADACVGIIDLGDMIRGPCVMEIAVAMAEFLMDGMPPEPLTSLLAGYTDSRPLTGPEMALLYDLILARIAVTVLIQTWRTPTDAPAASPGAATLDALSALLDRGQQYWISRWTHD